MGTEVRVRGRAFYANDCVVVGTVEGHDHRMGTTRIKTDTGDVHLCRTSTLVLVQPRHPGGSTGAIRHLLRCPPKLLHHLVPDAMPL